MNRSRRFLLSSVLWRTLVLVATAALFAASAAAATQRPKCEFQIGFPPSTDFDAAFAKVSSDSFAEAFKVYLDDLRDMRNQTSALTGRLATWRDHVCQPVADELNRYDSAVGVYNAGCSGARPPEISERCNGRKSELDAWHARVEPRRLAALADLDRLVAVAQQLEPLVRRAFDNARTVLDPDNTEQVLRLYIFWAVEIDKGTASRDRDSCWTFARIATALGGRVSNKEIFIDLLERNLHEKRPLTISLLTGSPPLSPVVAWAREYGSSTQAFNAKGFKKGFYDNISENQVRHAVGYMRIGYGFSGTAGDLVSLALDWRIGEEADYRLALGAAHMGWQLRRGRELFAPGFGRAIETRICE